MRSNVPLLAWVDKGVRCSKALGFRVKSGCELDKFVWTSTADTATPWSRAYSRIPRTLLWFSTVYQYSLSALQGKVSPTSFNADVAPEVKTHKYSPGEALQNARTWFKVHRSGKTKPGHLNMLLKEYEKMKVFSHHAIGEDYNQPGTTWEAFSTHFLGVPNKSWYEHGPTFQALWSRHCLFFWNWIRHEQTLQTLNYNPKPTDGDFEVASQEAESDSKFQMQIEEWPLSSPKGSVSLTCWRTDSTASEDRILLSLWLSTLFH